MGKIIYGGDYNPEQWLDYPDILEEDIRMMKQAGINEATIGVFSWAKLEPMENRYEFDWIREIIDKLWENGISVILATPSGARPRWLAEKYPEVLRVNELGIKQKFGKRHNHCLTSKAYRKKVYEIDRKLAEEFGNHPAVKYWHISNELSGECFCESCQQAFREYLKKKYKKIENLNQEWWTTFWSHTYNGFDDIEAPFEIGENELAGLVLDWKRFVTLKPVHLLIMRRKRFMMEAQNSRLQLILWVILMAWTMENFMSMWILSHGIPIRNGEASQGVMWRPRRLPDLCMIRCVLTRIDHYY